MEEEIKKEEPIDFLSKMVKPHTKISKVVDSSDMERVINDAHILYNLCHTQIGIHPGGYAVAHPQINDKDPLRFFVTRDKEIVINPVIFDHTESMIDSEEGCLSYPEYRPITVQRWNKCRVAYETLTPDGKIEKREENLSGKRAKIFQHEIGHFEGKYIFPIDLI